MFNSSTNSHIEDDHFSNVSYSNSIECISATAEIMVNMRTNGSKTVKPCYLYAEKLDFKGIIQLRLTEKCDHRKMYIATVDGTSFQELKLDQSLHVTFAGFIENLVHILADCKAGKLGIYLLQLQQREERRDIHIGELAAHTGEHNSSYQLQFVEARPFKNFIHLCLPCRLAPLNAVLLYMNNVLDVLQTKCLKYEQTIQQLQHETHNYIRRRDQLEVECKQLTVNHFESNRNLTVKRSDEMNHLQDNLRRVAEQRHQEHERNSKTITALQQQLDKLLSERNAIQNEKAQEVKRREILNEDLAAAKGRITDLKEQNEKLYLEVAMLKNLERQNEMHLQDSHRDINDLREKLKRCDKNKADLVAALEAEKKASQTKRQALEMAAEEISKANEIIFKQNQEFNKFKKTLVWRTEVVFKLEHAIKQKDLAIKECEEELVFLRATAKSLRQEIPRELDSMKKFAHSLETKYTEQINLLQMKLQPLGKENVTPSKKASSR